MATKALNVLKALKALKSDDKRQTAAPPQKEQSN